MNIQPTTKGKLSKAYLYDLTTKEDAKRKIPMKLEYQDGQAITDTLNVGPMPSIIVLEMKP